MKSGTKLIQKVQFSLYVLVLNVRLIDNNISDPLKKMSILFFLNIGILNQAEFQISEKSSICTPINIFVQTNNFIYNFGLCKSTKRITGKISENLC